MQILNSQFDPESFYARLEGSRRRLLMLDYDGTLAPFTPDRDRALPYPEIEGTLEQLFGSQSTRVVLISGRSTANLSELLPTKMHPEIWGCHGQERLTREGEYSCAALPEDTGNKLTELLLWIEETGLVEVSEFKPSGAAFHWRGLPSDRADEIKKAVLNKWGDASSMPGLELLSFDGGIEIRVAGTNKAIPVKQLLDSVEADTVSCYLGDDLTDEDAFRAIHGRGLSVLVRDSLRETAADLWLKPPDELAEFLTRWIR
ncbi:MAG: trehalose-phosphatase [Candidatus Zixiibacteriota bacterium]|nr:MAG: trehalose-phosphatase [candidate division Zixibacteria bacterium]